METIGQLTGGVAHDFNNLLTVIVGNLELVLRHAGQADEAAGARLRRAAENAMRGAERATALTQRLLAFARRQPLDPRAVDVNRLVAGMSDLFARTIGEHIAIETVLAARPVADAYRPAPARDRDPEPRGERARRHAGRRQAHHRDRQCLAGRGPRTPVGGRGRGTVCGGLRVGHRRRHEPRRARPGLRAVLHHQGHRSRHRPRAQPGLWIRETVRRTCQDLFRARRRHDREALSPAAGIRGQPGRAEAARW